MGSAGGALAPLPTRIGCLLEELIIWNHVICTTLLQKNTFYCFSIKCTLTKERGTCSSGILHSIGQKLFLKKKKIKVVTFYTRSYVIDLHLQSDYFFSSKQISPVHLRKLDYVSLSSVKYKFTPYASFCTNIMTPRIMRRCVEAICLLAYTQWCEIRSG